MWIIISFRCCIYNLILLLAMQVACALTATYIVVSFRCFIMTCAISALTDLNISWMHFEFMVINARLCGWFILSFRTFISISSYVAPYEIWLSCTHVCYYYCFLYLLLLNTFHYVLVHVLRKGQIVHLFLGFLFGIGASEISSTKKASIDVLYIKNWRKADSAVLILSLPKMFRLVQVLQAIAICAFFLVDARDVRLDPSLQEVLYLCEWYIVSYTYILYVSRTYYLACMQWQFFSFDMI